MSQDDPASSTPKNGRRRGGRGESSRKNARRPESDAAAEPADSTVATAAAAEPEVEAEAAAPAEAAVTEGKAGEPNRLDLAVLKEMSIQKLVKVAKGLDIPGAPSMKKQELVFQILRAQAEKEGLEFLGRR